MATIPGFDPSQVTRALQEDIGRGDMTSLACVPEDIMSDAVVLAKADGVVAGLPIFCEVMHQVDPAITIVLRKEDGQLVQNGDYLVTLAGPARSILTAERVALNYVGHLSGIATATHLCAAALEGTTAKIVDTRKTTPGLRALEKYAVRMGGGLNHRFGLDDGILIKDNHIVAGGGITQAVLNARRFAHHLLAIEVECDGLEQVREAMQLPIHAILLDNMSFASMREAVHLIRQQNPAIIIEASGNVGKDPDRIRNVGETGVDLISSGSLTHTVANFDISLDFVIQTF